EFDTDGTLTTPGSVGVRFDLDAPGDRGTPPFASLITSPESPTLARYIADEIEHAIRFSDLDVKVYRGTDHTMYIEGAVEIGEPDFDVPPTAFFIRDQAISELPLITSEKAQQGGVPYTRLVNNTLVGLGADANGESEFADIGVMIEDNASPTLLNNIVAYFDTGILADLSANDSTALRGTYVGGNDSVDQVWLNGLNSLQTIPMDANFAPYGPGAFEGLLFGAGFGISGGSFNTVLPDGSFILNHTLQDFDSDQTRYEGERATVVGATVFKANRDNVERIGKGDFAIELGANDPLFVDAASGNYLLTSGSQAIDSSVSDVPERIPLNQVLSNINVTSEGIAAPSRDAMGLERFDDPAIENQNGTGSNAFIDRGAFERADFVDPSARLVNPLDGGPDDADAAIDTVQVFNQVLTSFEIELTDRPSPADPLFGSGIDDATVSSTAVTVRRDDVELVEGEDYSFSYNIVADTIRLTPVTGIWEPDFVYTVTIDNTTIMDRSQNTLRGNQPDGTTVFLIGTGSGLDYGDAPGDYPTTRAENGASHASVEGVFLGAGVDVEVEAKDVDGFDDGVTFSGDILIGGTSTVEVVASTGGFLNAWMDFDGDGAWSGGEQVFSNEPLAAGVNSLIFNVPSGSAEGSTFARFRFDTTGGLEPTGPAADGEVEDYELNLLRNPWTNDNPLDVNNDSFPNGPDEPANALDALAIINVLTRIADGEEVPGVDGATGRLEIPRPADAEGFYDVNGDGFVTPLDALVVINRLENTAESAVQAPLSGGVTAGFQLDQRADDEEESLDDVIGQFAGEVGEAWSAE
ncbi:MAG: GEVED domain-containing protein, partial [Planctomycetota bacterium]